ncbi:hypothetical protein [Seonamhaeicola marinus]|uniref:Uncharacterized protein n=1 Tax=Seonamhaeicola marinus TaxID=1912246 RepID=A0A5D0HK42_9FLAO|nr:hypothetical protein [Seonamhaeicola marinus]TYA71676.1 hypothetical protein FUA24_19115 [Seonamhaeicola marinus]
MRKFLLVLMSISLITINACDDGDIIDVNLDFDGDYEACNGVDGLTLFKIKEDPSESLSAFISGLTINELFEVGDNDTLKIDDRAIQFRYRTYNEASLGNIFCQDIPPNVDITSDEQSDGSKIDILTSVIYDDNDGIASIDEDRNNDGNLENDDTDGDGVPDYKDFDDDGDNVATKDENPDPNGDGNLDDAQDTDGDGTPDYLDNDDDGDGVLTRDEEKGTPKNNNPADDEETIVGGGLDYLNPNVTDVEAVATQYRTHTVSKTFFVRATIKDIDISTINQEVLNFGVLDSGFVPANLKSEELATTFN